MSNIIKSYSVRALSDTKMTIDYKDRDDELTAKRIKKNSSKKFKEEANEEFREGLQAVVVDPAIIQEEQEREAAAIVEYANEEATDILNKAKEEALILKKDYLETAKKQGYEEGLQEANQEIEQIKRSLYEQEKQQKQEYQEILAGLEGQVAELMVSLLTKLTGILIEDKTDIILYLVEKALVNNDSKEDYTVKVSGIDYDVLSSNKEHIEGIIGREIKIVVDPQLNKNQCLIETESKIIDCSLDVQLNNLITDLKLLSTI